MLNIIAQQPMEHATSIAACQGIRITRVPVKRNPEYDGNLNYLQKMAIGFALDASHADQKAIELLFSLVVLHTYGMFC